MVISQCESCFSLVLLTRLVKIAHPSIATGKCRLGLQEAEGRTIAVAMECNGCASGSHTFACVGDQRTSVI
jgi:hypothetical protein